MRRKVAFSLLFLLILSALSLLLFHPVAKAQTIHLNIGYESGVFWGQQSDDVTGLVENIDTVAHNYRIVISEYPSGPTPTVVLDTGVQSLAGGQAIFHADYVVTIGSPADFTVEITTDSEKIVPSVLIIPQGTGPIPPRFWQSGSQLMKFRQ